MFAIHSSLFSDHCRSIGEILFADVDRRGGGVIEFLRNDDAKYCVKKLDDSKFTSHEVIYLLICTCTYSNSFRAKQLTSAWKKVVDPEAADEDRAVEAAAVALDAHVHAHRLIQRVRVDRAAVRHKGKCLLLQI
jgi:hypothetical protein